MRYLPDEELYQFTAVDKDGKKLVYKGALEGNPADAGLPGPHD